MKVFMLNGYRPYMITVVLSGHVNNFDPRPDGLFVFSPTW